LSQLGNKEVCWNEPAEFGVDSISNVSYQWQVKEPEGEWIPIGTSTNSFRISPVDPFFKNGNKVRVVIRPKGTQTCKVAVSNVATLTVKGIEFEVGPIEEETEVCPGARILYSI